MGDYFQTLVDPIVGVDECVGLMENLRERLIEKGIIERNPTHSGLRGPGTGHPPGPNYEDVVTVRDEDLAARWTDGVEFEPGYQVAIREHALAPCPECGHGHPLDAFLPAIWSWCDSHEETPVACRSCRVATMLTGWARSPLLTAGHLAVTFWNWPPLRPEFVEEMESVAGHELVLVSGKF